MDVAAARVLEPHLDAGAILSQAGLPESFTGSWGVFAAEAQGTRLTATPAADSADAPSGSAGRQPPSADRPSDGEAEPGGTEPRGRARGCS